MGHYYKRRRRNYGYAQNHISARRQLSDTVGGIDKDISRIFLHMREAELAGIFEEYGRRHGKSAQSYAQKTYAKWKSGSVQMSGQTAQRLLELVPPKLSVVQRSELIKKLRNHQIKREQIFVASSPSSWKEDLVDPVRRLVNKSSAISLPRSVVEKATWLSSGDSRAAIQLLNAAEQEEAIVRVAYLDAEFRRIEVLLDGIEAKKSISHEIELPQGVITVSIETPAISFFHRIKSFF